MAGTAVIHDPPSRYVVSWRPDAEGGVHARLCVTELVAQIQNQIGEIQIVDTRSSGWDVRDLLQQCGDGYRERADGYSDFICALTSAYMKSCREEDNHELVHWVLPQLDSDNGRIRVWAMRLDSQPTRDLGFSNKGGRRVHPWRSHKWHLIPPAECPHIRPKLADLASEISDRCIEPLKHTSPRCSACNPDDEAAPTRGLIAWLCRLFGRPRRNDV